MSNQKNVLGLELAPCSLDPLTGFFRDGCCNTGNSDAGTHTVCAIMTKEFLNFSKAQGNDLSTPRKEFNFPGLKIWKAGLFAGFDGMKVVTNIWCGSAPSWASIDGTIPSHAKARQ